jgi:hypothetical protein
LAEARAKPIQEALSQAQTLQMRAAKERRAEKETISKCLADYRADQRHLAPIAELLPALAGAGPEQAARPVPVPFKDLTYLRWCNPTSDKMARKVAAMREGSEVGKVLYSALDMKTREDHLQKVDATIQRLGEVKRQRSICRDAQMCLTDDEGTVVDMLSESWCSRLRKLFFSPRPSGTSSSTVGSLFVWLARR